MTSQSVGKLDLQSIQKCVLFNRLSSVSVLVSDVFVVLTHLIEKRFVGVIRE